MREHRGREGRGRWKAGQGDSPSSGIGQLARYADRVQTKCRRHWDSLSGFAPSSLSTPCIVSPAFSSPCLRLTLTRRSIPSTALSLQLLVHGNAAKHHLRLIQLPFLPKLPFDITSCFRPRVSRGRDPSGCSKKEGWGLVDDDV